MSTVPKITIEQAKIICANPANADLWMANQNQMIGAYNKALAEQQGNEGSAWYTPTSFIDKQKLRESQQESEYITAEQARELGAGKAEWSCEINGEHWYACTDGCVYASHSQITGVPIKYRAIKQAQPEPTYKQVTAYDTSGKATAAQSSTAQVVPVDPHAELRAEYIRQRDAVPCELGFYEWEYKNKYMTKFAGVSECSDWHEFHPLLEYRCTDISCYVSKDGEPAIRMLRTEAQELQAELGDTVEWFTPRGNIFNPKYHMPEGVFDFIADKTYTYRTKATIKLDGNMVTPEQAAAEREAKKETHDVYSISKIETTLERHPRFSLTAASGYWYELRPKQPTWTGSRDDVIALLKEMGVV